jgi:FG-GAP-like repeat/FG-GAP repeat
MKKHLALSVVLLLASLPSFASHSQFSPSSQFRAKQAFTPPKPHTAAVTRANGRPQSPQPAQPKAGQVFHPRSIKSRAHSLNPPTAGLVAATTISYNGAEDGNNDPVIGDFNGDGKPDLAEMVSNQIGGTTTHQISVVLSNGNGTFQNAQLTSTIGNTNDSIFVGDVNGDGKDDILQVHPGLTPSTVDVLLSNGDGTFTAGTNSQLSAFTLNGGILIDVNGDGKLDILTIDSQSLGIVSVALGNGNGTFQAATTLATLTGPAPNQIFFADFNGDGKLDFAGTVNNQLRVYLSSGSNFLSPASLVTSNDQYGASVSVAGDLTGDGKPEIISVNDQVNTVTVYVNNGDGTFQTGVYYNNTGNEYMYPYAAAVADFNQDGKNDLAVSDYYGGSVTIFTGNGDGTLTASPIAYDTGGYPYRIPLVGDFNSDGKVDVVVDDEIGHFVYLQGNGDGTFRAAKSYSLPDSFSEYAYTYSVATGDFNGDGFSDVVAGQDGNVNSPGIIVYLANTDGTLKPGVSYGTSSTLACVTGGDFNGDGKLDIAATNYSSGLVQIFLGAGDGTFTVGQSFATDTAGSPNPENLVAGDFNHDGKLDLAIANTGSDTIGVLFGMGDGTFGSPTSYAVEGNVQSVTAADLNGDGYLDLAVPFDTDSTNLMAVFLANADNSGTFGTESDIATGGGNPEYVAFGDLNGDGKVDMALAMLNGSVYLGAIVVALGNGDGTFQAATSYPTSSNEATSRPVNVKVLDFDGDGHLDVVYNDYDNGSVGILYGHGDGTFFDPIGFPTSAYAWGMAFGDFNGDGGLDVVVGNDYVGGVSVMLNRTGNQPNFSMGASSSTAAVTAGQPAIYNLTLTGQNGYSGTITLSCSGLPRGAHCSFSPSPVTAQNNVQATTLTITTTAAATAELARPALPNSKSPAPTFLASLSGMGLFGLVLAGGKKRSRRQMAIVLGVMLLVMIFTLAGCGTGPSHSSGGAQATPAGNYNVVVTSTGSGNAAPAHSMNLALVVQ